jgi:hypothetical protein
MANKMQAGKWFNPHPNLFGIKTDTKEIPSYIYNFGFWKETSLAKVNQ